MSYADEFLQMIDTFHSGKEVWDDHLDIKIMEQKIDMLKNPINKFPPRDLPYFSPSSSNSCPRELYMKIKGAKRDDIETQPHQGRWKKFGSMFGDLIQSDLLAIEKHYKRIHGRDPAFLPAKNEKGQPFWEGFVKECKRVEHKGHAFYLFGTLDGKMTHCDGTSVGLEIKTKQTTAAQTGHYKMKGPSEDHLKQISCYSIMYGIDDYIVFYGNLSKKSWIMEKSEYEKNPDIRAFDIHIEERHRQETLDRFAYILECVENNTPPALDLTKFNFNNYKTACALDLTDDEMNIIKQQATQVIKGNLPEYVKQNFIEAYKTIKEIRNNA